MIRSPLTGSEQVELLGRIPAAAVIEHYWRVFRIDVTRFFKEHASIDLYRCPDTGYRFYYPFDLAGDSRFYELLERCDWYYMDWKWEHDVARPLIGQDQAVLEIGCGRGSFLTRLQRDRIRCAGLELNRSALAACRARGLEVFDQTLRRHARTHRRAYDLVCAFQVLEHVAGPGELIRDSLEVLRPGGKLIVSVPNNGAFIGLDPGNYLNAPPHHMGLWDGPALLGLTRFFDLRLEGIHTEPLQAYHVNYYADVMSRQLVKKTRVPIPRAAALLRPGVKLYARLARKRIAGHTLMAVYVKLPPPAD